MNRHQNPAYTPGKSSAFKASWRPGSENLWRTGEIRVRPPADDREAEAAKRFVVLLREVLHGSPRPGPRPSARGLARQAMVTYAFSYVLLLLPSLATRLGPRSQPSTPSPTTTAPRDPPSSRGTRHPGLYPATGQQTGAPAHFVNGSMQNQGTDTQYQQQYSGPAAAPPCACQ